MKFSLKPRASYDNSHYVINFHCSNNYNYSCIDQLTIMKKNKPPLNSFAVTPVFANELENVLTYQRKLVYKPCKDISGYIGYLFAPKNILRNRLKLSKRRILKYVKQNIKL